MQRIIAMAKGTARMPQWSMAEPVDFELCDGEHIAVIGPNGAGKSMFIDLLTGRHPTVCDCTKYDFSPSTKPLVSDNIKYITFKDSYGDSDGTYYLQQRWNQHDISEDTPTVGELLENAYQLTGDNSAESNVFKKKLYSIFGLYGLLDKYIILLSSGELRKFQLTRTLLARPRVLVMDNPFIGLDAETRLQLDELLTTISRETALQIITVVSRVKDIPSFTTHVVMVEDMKVGKKTTVSDFLASLKMQKTEPKARNVTMPGNEKGYGKPCNESLDVIKMNDITIRYGARTILNHLSWTVKQGEHWAVSGRNGAGKSTLLSLVCADNPQAYACDIALFGRKRGTGESIWDIKKRIGYVSPEMHRAYHRDIQSIMVVASGLKDTVGLYAKPNADESETCRRWMDVFGIKSLADKTFMKLSSGEQRLVLLARAFVKDPDLLILDEPFHGLDDQNRAMVTDIIECFCRRHDKTLVMVSHYQEELPRCIDHQLTLKHNA